MYVRHVRFVLKKLNYCILSRKLQTKQPLQNAWVQVHAPIKLVIGYDDSDTAEDTQKETKMQVSSY